MLLNIQVFWIFMPCWLGAHVCSNLMYAVHSYTTREVQHKYMSPSLLFLHHERQKNSLTSGNSELPVIAAKNLHKSYLNIN
jgi:hypothetical protein